MTLDTQTKALLIRRIEEAERILHHCRQVLEGKEDRHIALPPSPSESDEDEAEDGDRVVRGIFDGEHMKGEDTQLYPVPANYASKSKLVEKDELKLTIKPDGAFVYKQTGPVERKRVKGTFAMDPEGKNVVRMSDGKEYRILLASVTFYHIEPGDEVTILLPDDEDATWGTVDNVIKQADLPEEENETEE